MEIRGEEELERENRVKVKGGGGVEEVREKCLGEVEKKKEEQNG